MTGLFRRRAARRAAAAALTGQLRQMTADLDIMRRQRDGLLAELDQARAERDSAQRAAQWFAAELGQARADLGQFPRSELPPHPFTSGELAGMIRESLRAESGDDAQGAGGAR